LSPHEKLFVCLSLSPVVSELQPLQFELVGGRDKGKRQGTKSGSLKNRKVKGWKSAGAKARMPGGVDRRGQERTTEYELGTSRLLLWLSRTMPCVICVCVLGKVR